MPKGVLRLASVGACGNGAKLLAEAIPMVDGLEIVAACDTRTGDELESRCSAWGCQPFPDLPSALARMGRDIDIVHVATPSGAHKGPLEAALKAGKHCLSDKPLEVTQDRMRSLCALAEQSKGRLAVVSQNRWLPGAQLTWKVLQRGGIGRLRRAVVISCWKRANEYYDHSWRGTWPMDGGAALNNQTIHGVDLVTLGCSIALGMAREQMVKSIDGSIARITHLPSVLEAEDVASMNLTLENDVKVEILATTSADPEEPWTILFEGTGESAIGFNANGNLIAYNLENSGPEDDEAEALMKPDGPEDKGGAADPLGVGSVYHAAMLRQFVQCLQSGDRFELEGLEGAWAGMLIREFYAVAHDPQNLRKAGFVK